MRNILIFILLNIFIQRFACESNNEIKNKLLPINNLKENVQSNLNSYILDVIHNGVFKGIFKRNAPDVFKINDSIINENVTFAILEQYLKDYMENLENEECKGEAIKEAAKGKKNKRELINENAETHENLQDEINNKSDYKTTKCNDSAVNLTIHNKIDETIKEHVKIMKNKEPHFQKEEILARINKLSNIEDKYNRLYSSLKNNEISSNKQHSIRVQNVNQDDSFRNHQDIKDDSKKYTPSPVHQNRKQRLNNNEKIECCKNRGKDKAAADHQYKRNENNRDGGGYYVEVEGHKDGYYPRKVGKRHEHKNQDLILNKRQGNKISIKSKRDNEDFLEIKRHNDGDYARKPHKRENSLYDREPIEDSDKKVNSYIFQKQKKHLGEFYEDMEDYHIENKGIHKDQEQQAAITQELETEGNGQNRTITKEPYNENVEKIKVYLMKDTKDAPTFLKHFFGKNIKPNEDLDESELKVQNIKNTDSDGNGAKNFESKKYKSFFPTDSKIKPKNKMWTPDDASIEHLLNNTYKRTQEQIMKNIQTRHRLCGHTRKVAISNPDNCPQLTCSNKKIVKHAWIDCMFGRASRVRVVLDSNTSDVNESDGDRLADIDSADESTMNLAQRMTRYQCVCDFGYLIHGGDCIRPNECIIHMGKDPVVLKNYERQLGMD